MKRWLRGLSIFVRLLPYVLGFLRDRRRWLLLGPPARRSTEDHERRAARLTDTLASLGPTFIKLAQLMSARADLFPEPYLNEIGRLQDQVPPRPVEEIREVMERELDGSLSRRFERFDAEPLAAASLGQVHRARVDGREVAVKVLRPGVEEMVALDLDISFRILFWLNVLFPNHHVRGLTHVVREFSVKVREEMNFHQEAENIARFRRLFRDEPKVRAPEVLEEHTTRRVLVMEYCSGTKIDRLGERIDSGELELEEIMERLTGLYLRMMMVDGFLHADPHPGNLLIQDDGTLVVLDWGMVLEVRRWTREAILDLALAVEREDLDSIINGMYRLGMITPEVARGEIREAAVEVLRIMERARASGRERLQDVVERLFDTFYTWPLMLPQELVYFFRASMLLEGIGFGYDPRFDGLGLVRRVIRAHRSRILRATGHEPMALARDLFGELHSVLRTVRDLLVRAEREELRVRVHPRDVQAQERFMHLQARRLLVSVFAGTTGAVSAILFIALRSYWILVGGLAVSLFLFLLVFLIPTHLLENPLRHARGLRSFPKVR